MINRIRKQSAHAFRIAKGERLKVIDPQGKQVSDMVLFNAEDPREKISSGKSIDFEETLLITSGNRLWSNRGRVMMQILEDTNGRNDFLLAPCSKETFEHLYDDTPPHPGCFENLAEALGDFGIRQDDIPTAFNIFMNVRFKNRGSIRVKPPTSKAGDYVLLEAHMDLIVGLTACAAEKTNNYRFKPIDYEILTKPE